MKSQVIKSPLFWIGLVLKAVTVFLIIPQAVTDWYVPFISHSVTHFSFDPWGSFLSSGGSSLAFPYGTMQWLTLLPGGALSNLLNIDGRFGYALTLLIADFFMLLLLTALFQIKERKTLTAYWLSPIVFFATYWFGLNDLLCITALTAAFLLVKRKHLIFSSIALSIAVSLKLSIILALPFFAVYLFRSKKFRNDVVPTLITFFICSTLLWFPFIFSDSARIMLYSNPEVSKVFNLRFNTNMSFGVYVLPMLYLLSVYLFWNLKRIGFTLLLVSCGMCFFMVLLLTPAAPGWFIWVVPLLVHFQVSDGRKASVLILSFTLLYIAANIPIIPQPVFSGFLNLSDYAQEMAKSLGAYGLGMIDTAMLSVGLIIVIRIWQSMIRNDYFYRQTRKPLVIGIAGDSGVGKDNLVQKIISMFGKGSVVHLSGDNYHLWDRAKPIWSFMTHLNTRANDLERFSHDISSLVEGRSIMVSHYDHKTGKRQKPNKLQSNEVIIVSGLHTFVPQTVQDHFDLKIFVDMDEDLRRFFKIKRDVNHRSQKKEDIIQSIENRLKDSMVFIKPQKEKSDLCLKVLPENLQLINRKFGEYIPLKVQIQSNLSRQESNLTRELIGFCGLHIDLELSDNADIGTQTLSGNVSKEDVACVAEKLYPQLLELLDKYPDWDQGVNGLLQLITLSQINMIILGRKGA